MRFTIDDLKRWFGDTTFDTFTVFHKRYPERKLMKESIRLYFILRQLKKFKEQGLIDELSINEWQVI